MKEYKMTEDMADNQSLLHMKTEAGSEWGRPTVEKENVLHFEP